MDLIGRGIIAGFAATVLLSTLLDPIAVLACLTGLPRVTWPLHLLLGGCVWGAAFALAHDRLRGPSWMRGMVFATASSLLFALLVTAFEAGEGVLPLGAGSISAVMLLHAAYGAALGGIYAFLIPESEMPQEAPALDHVKPGDRLGSALR